MRFETRRTFIKYFLSLALPVVLQQLLVNLLGMSDTIMIGVVGEDAISATTVANKFFFIYNLVIFGLTNGIGLFISQYVGAKDKENYNRVLRLGLKISIFISLLCMLILFVCPNMVLELYVKNPKIISLGLKYNNIVRFSYLAFGVSQMMAVAYRVKGNTKLPMQTGIVSFIVNIVFNYLLIYGKFGFPELGIAGAAIATTLSRYIEMILLLAVALNKNDDYYLFKKYKSLPLKMVKHIINRTLPLVGNEFIWSLSLNFIFMNYCLINESCIPALTVVDQISSLVYVVFAGFSTAVGVIIGNTLGANELELAKKEAKLMIKIGLAINIIGTILLVITSKWTTSMFSLEPHTHKLAILLLNIKCAVMWTQGYSETLYYIFRAGGDTKSVLFIDGIFMLVGPMLLSTVFSRIIPLSLVTLFIVVEGVNVFKIFVATYFYKKETWVKNLTQLQET